MRLFHFYFSKGFTQTVPCLLLELLDAFLKAVPVVGLACTPDAAAVDTLEAYLQAQTETAY